MEIYKRTFFIAALLLGFQILCPGQRSESAVESVLERSNKIYGVDDLIMNGQRYKASNIKADGHPYFSTKNVRTGNVYIKGKNYEDVEMKYELISNNLLLKVTAKNAWFSFVIGNPALIDSFKLENRKFVNARIFGKNGYFEEVYSGKISFYKRWSKVFKEVYSTKYPHGFFLAERPVFFIYQNNRLTKIRNKKALLQYFSDDRKTINKYLKSKKIKLKTATNIQLAELSKFCNEL